MVVRANIRSEGIGGHLATYASSAALYEVGFNHFFRGKDDGGFGRPGLLPGPRLARHLRPGLRRGPPERGPARQLPLRGRAATACRSYPHPRLVPDFWEYPTVSMGLGPLNAIDQAHLNRYLQPGASPTPPPAGVVLRRRRRDATSPRRSARWAWPAASTSTTSSSSSTATCSASTARCGATARSSRSSRPSSAAPGWNVIKVIWGSRPGTSCSPATSTACCWTR